MPAYVIVDVEITDPVAYEEYKKLTPASIAAYEGKFIVRGGETLTIEGDWQPGRIVVLEFPTMERAREWWHSEQYTAAKLIRHAAARSKMIFVQGV
ncbi:MAG: DUF1330 domain-containing protein [Chitinophagaceae bacterium]|nr:DUF1330 domain-containing protein [Chitinophagaceae bacterium]